MIYAIRPMTPNDLPGVLAVAVSGWGRLHAQSGQPDFNEMFASAAWRPFFYVAECEGIIGMAGYGATCLNYGIYDLFWVGVLESYRGNGIGKALVDRCLLDLYPIADQIILVTDLPDFYIRHWNFTTVCPIPTTQGPNDVFMIKSNYSNG